jgi:hypothetical protein
MDFFAQIDVKRLAAAEVAFKALEQAEADAGAELEAAKTAAAAAHAAAQSGADRGEDLKTMDALEVAVDAADRRVRTGGRLLEAARKRREAGERVRDAEVKQSHGRAMNTAMQRFIEIRGEALAAFAKLEALKDEHLAVRAAFLALATAAKAGVPNLIDANHELISSFSGQMISDAEFANRISQGQYHEWDAAAGKLRWVE